MRETIEHYHHRLSSRLTWGDFTPPGPAFRRSNGTLSQKFEQVVQSWDTANKDSELANYSVCTTWGKTNRNMYLLNVFRRRLNFPELKREVREQASRYNADVVLIEDKASGTSLIQELKADGFWKVQAAPRLDGDKIMRLHGQTAKIAGGYALFPRKAPWLDTYLHELTGFPNAKYDDQVDSTVYALAWSTPDGNAEIWIRYVKEEGERHQFVCTPQPECHLNDNSFRARLFPSATSRGEANHRKRCIAQPS